MFPCRVHYPEPDGLYDLEPDGIYDRKTRRHGKYFTINRSRQYGKTTTIDALCRTFSKIMLDTVIYDELQMPDSVEAEFELLAGRSSHDVKLDELFRIFRNWFLQAEKPIVLIIDEVDNASDQQTFLDFLAQLRSLFLKKQRNNRIRTFQSVILAGVSDRIFETTFRNSCTIPAVSCISRR